MMSVRQVALFIVGLLVLVRGDATNADCLVTLSTIQQNVQDANAARALCERNYFTGGDCQRYWMLMNTIVSLQFSYQSCSQSVMDNLVLYLQGDSTTEGMVEIQGELTRLEVVAATFVLSDALNANTSSLQTVVQQQAQATQSNVTATINADGTFTRNVISLESSKTQANTTAEATITRTTVSDQNAATRANTTAEATSTRTTVVQESRTIQALVSLEAQATRTNTSAEAQATRADIDLQHSLTRTLVSTEANNTRNEIRNQHTNTRADVDAQNANTRTTLVNEVDTQAALTRVNITAESQLTRQKISDTGDAVRANVSSEAGKTRDTLQAAVQSASATVQSAVANKSADTQNVVKTQSAATNNLVSAEANNTRNTVQQGVASIVSTQTTFQTLFMKIMIEAAFANVDNNGGNIDIFQRPASDGGYYETAKAIVSDVITYNSNRYGLAGVRTASVFYAAAGSYERAGNYKAAFNNLQSAYIQASS